MLRHLGAFDLDAGVLRTYPGNPRKGDLDALADSLRAHGQYRALVVQADDPSAPQAGGVILAGNHTFLAATEKLGHQTLRCDVLDCDADQARRIVLIDNRLADKARYHDDALLSLLQDASASGGLDGTGWTTEELTKLAGVLPEPGDADTSEMPAAWGVVVECDSEAQQADLLGRLAGDGLKVRALMSGGG